MKAKIEQAGAEHVDELVDVVGGLLGDLLAGDHLGLRRQDVLDRLLDGRDVGTVGDGDVDRVDLAVGGEALERGVEVERDELGTTEAVGAAQPDRRR